MKHYILLLGILCINLSCSEPAKEVTGISSDGQFELRLTADPNWVRPNASLLIKVEVNRLNPNAALAFSDRIEFTVNNGTITPPTISVSFPALPSTSPPQKFTQWVTYRAGNTRTQSQGEIHALFKNGLTTLKIRIVPEASE